MAENPEKRTLTFHGERVTWISPGTLKDLLELKVKHPDAPLILGNTSLGEWRQQFSGHTNAELDLPSSSALSLQKLLFKDKNLIFATKRL